MTLGRLLLTVLTVAILSGGLVILFRARRLGKSQHTRQVAFRVAAMFVAATFLPFRWFVANHLSTPLLAVGIAIIVGATVCLYHLGTREDARF
jgi:hypothetical protein